MTYPPVHPGSAPTEPVTRTGLYLRLCGVDPAAVPDLAQLPVDELQRRVDAWSAGLLAAPGVESSAQQRARARAQLLLARLPGQWPAHFLRPPPPALADAARSVPIEAKRPLRQASMTPQPIDLGPVSDVADETWKTFDTWPLLRGLTLWLLFALLLGAVFYVVRF